MKTQTKAFINRLLFLFPQAKEKYNKYLKDYMDCETIIIEDVLMPEVINLINEDKNIALLKEVFNFFEEVSNSNDKYLLNVFSITTLEILGNDKETLKIAKKYMGFKTCQLQIEADKALGRI